jgi:tripartite-type tricarboxylate transporter receptor subunit TctC
MQFTRRRAFSVFGGAMVAAWQGVSHAQEYPIRPINIVVPFPPGGPTDLIARAGTAQLQEALGQPMLLVHKPGATGNIAGEYVARAPADGYTVMLGNIATNAINAHVIKSSSFQAKRDLAPICALVQPLLCLVAHPSMPARNLAELITYAKQNPGKLRYASSGIASPHHLAGALMSQLAGIEWIHVPYQGGAPAANDLVGGQVDVAFLTLSAALPFQTAGRLRILGMTESKRTALLPDVPSISETIPNFEMRNWQGLFGPMGMPTPVVERLQREFYKAYTMPSVRASLESRGMEVIVGSTSAFAGLVNREHDRWGQVIKATNITLE